MTTFAPVLPAPEMYCVIDEFENERGQLERNPHTTAINYFTSPPNHTPYTREDIYEVLWRDFGIQGNLVDGTDQEIDPEAPNYLDPSGNIVICEEHFRLSKPPTPPTPA